jgi:phosphoribosyl-AMP cyclohydrolase
MFDPETLTYDERGLIPAIAQDHATGEVLMLAWMNAEAVRRTLDSKRVTYWSRSRQAFWVKGETSGHVQDLVEMRHDCDGDALLLSVRQTGPACHTGARSCFFTAVAGPAGAGEFARS